LYDCFVVYFASLTLSPFLLFSSLTSSQVHFILIGESEEDLQVTAETVASLRPTTVTSELMLSDLADHTALLALAERLFSSRSFTDYTHVTFINNAQTIQPIGNIDSGIDPSLLSRAIQLNVTSPMYLTSECMRAMRDTTRAPARAAVVNISSLWATEAAASFGTYSASKAAMEMYYEVLAKETSEGTEPPAIKVLNYSPGPLDSAMQEEIRESPHSDPNWQMSCCQMKKEGTLIHPDKSARKCALLIIQELYDSGDHIDYYDQIEGVDYLRKVITTCCSNPNCQCGVNCRCSMAGPQCGGCQSFMLQNR
jgi:sepiapterin reductase